MKTVTAQAPANLAFVKYWGNADGELNLPANNSISINLSEAKTFTTVEFDAELARDQIRVLGGTARRPASFERKIIEHLDRIRSIAGVNVKASLTTHNTFPDSVGIASSASGFAALTVAAACAAGLELSQRELSALARLGSGSACRSIPDGFVEWLAGTDHVTSYAISIAPPDHWDIAVVTVIVSRSPKRQSSQAGHSLAVHSPFFKSRLESLPARLDAVRSAIAERDLDTLGREVEQDALSLHAIAMTSPVQTPGGWLSGAYYWAPESLELMLATQAWRLDGLKVYFTLDAGPTVHLVCLPDQVPTLLEAVKQVEQAQAGRDWKIVVNSPAPGAGVIEPA